MVNKLILIGIIIAFAIIIALHMKEYNRVMEERISSKTQSIIFLREENRVLLNQKFELEERIIQLEIELEQYRKEEEK